MFLRKLFPYALAGFSILGMSWSALAQTAENRPRQVAQVADTSEAYCSPDDPVTIFETSAEDLRPAKPVVSTNLLGAGSFQQLLSAAIDERLGSPYRWGATGPNAFDCSGFVWSIFQSAGITFERGSARALWGRFESPTHDEQFKFGTLVFFSGLAHGGMGADERVFYHASRHHGGIY